HTNDAASGVTRLLDIGIEPYLISSSVIAFIAQRLVRVICDGCRVENKNSDPAIVERIARAFNMNPDEIKLYEGKGCQKCNMTGFYGRTAIYEVLILDKDIRRLILDRAISSEIKKAAILNGMRTLLRDGLEKVLEGVTTPGEVFNVCQQAEEYEFDIFSPPAEQLSKSAYAAAPDAGLKQEAGKKEDDAQNKRLYVRAPVKVRIQYRLVKKGSGEIFKLEGALDKGAGEIMIRRILDDSVLVKAMEGVYQEVDTTSLNVSAGGVAFESQYSFPVDSVIEIKMFLPGQPDPVTSLARVVRVEKDLPVCFYLAVCFLDMSGESRAQIDRLVKGEAERQKPVNLG
ncbi:MAG: ATPase, T2SS/T4P/T4SS family, partial [Candidatus Omnitrophota bacterium]